MSSKIITVKEVQNFVQDNFTIMVGGFMTNGTPHKLVETLVEKNYQSLTLICNDAGLPNQGSGMLLTNKQVKKLYASHIGLNREAGRQMNDGELEIDLIPQGTLVERIRAGGYGLGGFLTPTGLGTLIENDKQTVTVNNKQYLLELPLVADVALIFADVADESGNLQYRGSENNFNATMASAAKITIVEARKIVPVGSIDPNLVHTPNIFVNYIVSGGDTIEV